MLKMFLVLSAAFAANFSSACTMEQAFENPAVSNTFSGIEGGGYACNPPASPNLPKMPIQRVFEAICEKPVSGGTSRISFIVNHLIVSGLACDLTVIVKGSFVRKRN